MVDPAKETTALKVICLMYIVSKETKSIQDSEADTTSSGLLPSSVDIQTLIHRLNQTAHISLQIPIFQRASKQNQPEAPIYLAQPANHTSDISNRFPSQDIRLSPVRVPEAH
ncbi:hypothetical protein, partial [Roseovarius sp. A-2]|uniref:hypothetical protein n=1 Tax=Roseovarius sp. A-2 TaxID=1570360 RepID=UPI001C3914EC